jgi:hypothetical protein
MPTIQMPTTGLLGLPEGTKEAGKRVDFKPNDFAFLIETKGYLIAWERASMCPCTPVATQTQQADPNCELCGGSGWFYFGPPENDPQDLDGYEFDDLQADFLEQTSAYVIRGIMTSVNNNPDNLNVVGNWVGGTSNLTVRAENKVGYYDKITVLDAQIVFAEMLEADGTLALASRYPLTGINYLRSESTVYEIGTDYYIEKGQLLWYSGKQPASGTRVAAHYLCYPTYLISDHPHVARVTSIKYKTASPKTPTGEPKDLPVQALIKYDFLPEE